MIKQHLSRLVALALMLTLVAPGGVALAGPPGPGGLSPDLWVFLVEGPLPWPLPTLPDTDMTEITVGALVGPAEGASYTSDVSDLDDEFQDYEDTLDSYESTVDTLRSTINAPASAGNFNPGLEPDDESTTLYDMADDIGASVGEFLGYLRVLRVTDINSSGAFFAMLFLALGWVFFVLFAKVVLGAASDVFGLLWKLWEAIPFLN